MCSATADITPSTSNDANCGSNTTASGCSGSIVYADGLAKTPSPYTHAEENSALKVTPGDPCDDLKRALQILNATIAWRITDLNSESVSYAGHLEIIEILKKQREKLERAYKKCELDFFKDIL
ncbi:hypothetical protein VQ643_15910 [Pseudomonas sp. F1_0610]|uniref:hypothetical protein n=1 Tax=Pseudomonas sp. F1_0610 TaxID=3114284 RepID=UPI0039C29665